MGVKFQNIVCKTIGITGMSAALYDAYSVAKATSSRTVQATTADYFESIHANNRTLSTESPVKSSLQQSISKLRTENPIVPICASVQGFVSGTLKSLADNLVPVTCASLAIAGKGAVAKIGAWGVGIYGLYSILKEGFGFGKSTPIN